MAEANSFLYDSPVTIEHEPIFEIEIMTKIRVPGCFPVYHNHGRNVKAVNVIEEVLSKVLFTIITPVECLFKVFQVVCIPDFDEGIYSIFTEPFRQFQILFGNRFLSNFRSEHGFSPGNECNVAGLKQGV
jgi:hypothetical protein